MDVATPAGWRRIEYDGKLPDFNLYPPLLTYEHAESETRVLAKPLVSFVPEAESELTVEEVVERRPPTGATGGEAINSVGGRAVEGGVVPEVFPDAPIDDPRFEDTDWRIALQPIRTPPADRDDGFRPDTRKLPVADLTVSGRTAAQRTLRFVLDRGPRMDENDPVWRP